MNYSYLIRIQDMMSGPLMRISATYSSQVSRWDGLTRRVQNGFNRAAQTVGQLRTRLMSLRGGNNTIDGQNNRLNRLQQRRRVAVDTSEINRLDQLINRTQNRLNTLRNGARPDRNGRLRLANGRFAGDGSGGGRSGGGFGFGDFSMGGLMRKALPYVSAAAIGSAALGIGKDAMAQERDQFSLGVMLKSKQQAAGMMGQFREFAMKNPMMGMEETTQAGTRLVSLNERTDRVMPIIRTVSDVSAATNNKLSDLIGVLGQVKSKGRLYAEENLQFQERRVNLNPYLAKVLGVKQDRLADLMKDGKIGYEQVLRAMNLMTAKGGIYEGMSEKMGNETSYGKFQNLLETIKLQFVDLGVKVLPYVNKGLEWASRLADGFQKELNGKLGTTILNTISQIATMGGQIWDFAKLVGLVSSEAGKSGTAMTALSEGLRTVGSLARWIGWTVQKLGPILKSLPGFGMMSAGMDVMKWANDQTDAFMGKPNPLKKAQDKATTEEKWVKANGLTGLPANEQHDKFVEARWRASQSAAFKNLSDSEKHNRFLAAQARSMKNNTGLLGASGLMESTKEKNKKAKDASGIDASTGGARSTNITINLKSLVEKLEIRTPTVGEGLTDMESQVTDILLRVLNSANAMPT